MTQLPPPWIPQELMHYGILRKSGRYPWGSGGNELARANAFYEVIDKLYQKGPDGKPTVSEADVAKLVGLSVADLRSARTIAREVRVEDETNKVLNLKAKDYSDKAISEATGLSTRVVQERYSKSEKRKESSLRATAEVVRKAVEKFGIVDVGKGTEHLMGIASTRLSAALSVLRDEGMLTYNLRIRQPGTNQFTTNYVIVPEGTSISQAYKLKNDIHTMGEWSEDGGVTYFGIRKPLSISSDRLQVRFDEDGGTKEDGTVYVRRGVPDLDMGRNTYAQVRIAIDDTHFIKGIAIAKDDLPPGVDLVFNSNKPRSVGKLGALKELKDDPENPFGSMISRQLLEVDPKTGEERARSAINLVNEEGDWDNWRKSLPSQFLAKQPHSLIKSQLAETRKQIRDEITEINKITNPVVRKAKLEEFAERVDSDAVDLRAASMPRQQTRLILPLPKMRPTEVYAPGFENGEPVVLVRYPHGGQFEIPELIVNNNLRSAKKLFGNAPDAIGIHPSVAERLSGADFDGDTVVVIPNSSRKIKSHNTMSSNKGVYERYLGDFDAKQKYGGFEESGKDSKGNPVGNFKLMTNTGMEMGMITNLITDMQIQGARAEHVARAVRHSMVVIDAEKHKLDYRRSAVENNIAQLKELYQGSSKAGAQTLLSRATAKADTPERVANPALYGGPVDKETGAKVWRETGRMNNKYDPKTKTYTDEKVPVNNQVKRLALTDDAYDLVRDRSNPSRVEKLYADHANEAKALANSVRLQALQIPNPPTSTAAKKVYQAEVADLIAQVKAAEKQSPLDRRAQRYATAVITQALQDDPSLRSDYDRKKKVERQAKAGARARLGLSRPTVTISDSAWDAIQSGAVTPSRIRDILKYADPKRVDELSRPRQNTVMSGAILARAKAMLAGQADTAAIARNLGIPVSTLREAIKRGDL